MEAVAKIKYLKGSPRKARLVIDLVRGENVSKALAILKYANKRAATPISKCIRSAIANATYAAEQKNIAIDPDDLWVKTCFVDMGPTKNRRRLRPAPQGRAYQERRHYCHITIMLSSEEKDLPKGSWKKSKEDKAKDLSDNKKDKKTAVKKVSAEEATEKAGSKKEDTKETKKPAEKKKVDKASAKLAKEKTAEKASTKKETSKETKKTVEKKEADTTPAKAKKATKEKAVKKEPKKAEKKSDTEEKGKETKD